MYGKSSNRFQSAYFIYSIIAICLAYLVCEFFYIPRSALSSDEFVFGRHIYEYTHSLPYRDFPPYKAVLGYYLLSIPMFFSHTLLAPLFYIKFELAIINAGCMALLAFWCKKIFNPSAILITLMSIIASMAFIDYATDLRVDMLTTWMCLFAGVAALQYRVRLAGVLMGLAFLISQKALWYFLAINGAVFVCHFTVHHSRYNKRSLIEFNAITIAIIFVYALFWSIVSSPKAVITSLFYEAYIQAGIDWYEAIYFLGWQVILHHGPVLFLLLPLSLAGLFSKHDDKNTFLFYFCAIALVLFFSYKQPFPYNFVFTIPALFLLYANFFSSLFAQAYAAKERRLDTILTGVHVVLIISLVAGFSLPVIYYSTAFLPILFQLYKTRYQSRYLRAFVTLFIVTGIAWPLVKSLQAARIYDGEYQQTMIAKANHLLLDGDEYVAGTPFIYNKEQGVEGMKNIIGPQASYFVTPNEKEGKLLLPSLYLTETTQAQILQNFEKAPVKIVINNPRVIMLPGAIVNYIANHYRQYDGSIYLYAPKMTRNQLSFYLKFDGQYRVAANPHTKIMIDKRHLKANSIVTLKKGDHTSSTNSSYRLEFIPEEVPANTSMHDNWLYMLKAIMT